MNMTASKFAQTISLYAAALAKENCISASIKVAPITRTFTRDGNIPYHPSNKTIVEGCEIYIKVDGD